MKPFAEIFADYLTSKDLHYSTRQSSSGNTLIDFPYKGKNTIISFGGDRGEYVSMTTYYENVPQDKYAEALLCCNALNMKYKWLKFYIDNDNDITVEDDAIVSEDNCAEECFELLVRRFQILDEAKPDIMKALYA